MFSPHSPGQGAAAVGEVLKTLIDRYHDDPVRMVLETYAHDPEGGAVQVDPGQREILESVARNKRTAVRSAHGVGKTTTTAWLSHWWMLTRYPSLVVTIAGTWPQLENRLWPEVRTWAGSWKFESLYEWMHQSARLNTADAKRRDSVRMVASASDKGVNVEGFHSPNLLIIIDEAKAVVDEVWNAIQGALTNKNYRLVVLSTPPVSPAGWYPDLFGSKSVGWNPIHISAAQSPRVSRDYCEDIARSYGLGSAMYQSKVLGEIPDASAQVVIPASWAAAAQRLGPVKDRKRPVITCDVAREGEDLTVIGRIMSARFEIRKTYPMSTTDKTVAAIRFEVMECQAAAVVVDEGGVGGGVVDILLMLQRQREFPNDCAIIGVKFGESARRENRYHDRKSELWWTTRLALQQRRIALPSDIELANQRLPFGSDFKSQLLAPIYSEDLLNRIQVWDHRKSGKPGYSQEWMRALPTKSPDLAQALVLGVEHYLSQEDTQFAAPETPPEAQNREFWEGFKGKPDHAGEAYGYSDRFAQFYPQEKDGGDRWW
jgi:phage terminase large subunit